MRITRVYTRTGDKGLTALADGSRVPKDSLRLEAYGTLDELNAIVGVCRQHLDEMKVEDSQKIDLWLEAIQNDLFNLGSDLATPLDKRWPGMVVVGEAHAKNLEEIMDALNLPPLREFVLPGGTRLNSYLHMCRTVCRRAERQMVALQREETINPFAVPFVNRLSDFFFVVSRWVQISLGRPEITWDRNKGLVKETASNG